MDEQEYLVPIQVLPYMGKSEKEKESEQRDKNYRYPSAVGYGTQRIPAYIPKEVDDYEL